jgi:hypothetical protein
LKKVVTKASKRYPFTRVKQRHGCRLAPDSETGEAGSIVVVPQDAGRTGRVPGGTLSLAAPCPNCGTGLALEARVESVEDGDFELPLDDELYD